MQILLKKIFGSKSDREVKKLLPIVSEVNQFAEKLKTKSEDELISRAQEMKSEIISSRINFEKN